MMMIKQAVFIALFAVVAVSAKKPCCGPNQFMAGNGATVGESNPEPTGYFVYTYGAYDYTNSMFGYNVSIVDARGNTSTYRLIQKYSQGNQYVILDSLKYCQKLPVTYPEPINCIPDNATFTSSFFQGGINGLYSDSWTYNYVHPKDPIDGMIVINVAQETCYPVGASLLGTRYDGPTPVPLVSSSGVLNMTIGIPNPGEWFTVPSFCPTEANSFKTRGERSIPDLLNPDFFYLPPLY